MTESNNEDSDFTQRLKEYKEALEQEWENSNPSVNDPPEELARKARALVIQSMPQLIQKANLLALGASSESVALSAVKFLYQIVVPPKTMAPGEVDPLEKLFRELGKNDAKDQPVERED
jgi:hypothetical protein